MQDDITLKSGTNSRPGSQMTHKSPSAEKSKAPVEGFATRTKAQIKSGRLINRERTMEESSSRRRRRYRIRKYINCSSAAFGGLEGQMVNVSEAGVMLRSRKSVSIGSAAEPGSSIQLTVSVPSDDRTKEGQVRLEAVPVWCTKKGADGYYEMGLEWRRLSVPKRLMIKHWQRYCADQL